jgi:arylsulfatase
MMLRVKPYWPPRRAAEGAPNVLLIMTDDQGYASSTFGGVIPAPVLDRIAKRDFDIRSSTPPALLALAAALLTGRNHHSVGFVIAEQATGFRDTTYHGTDNAPS